MDQPGIGTEVTVVLDNGVTFRGEVHDIDYSDDGDDYAVDFEGSEYIWVYKPTWQETETGVWRLMVEDISWTDPTVALSFDLGMSSTARLLEVTVLDTGLYRCVFSPGLEHHLTPDEFQHMLDHGRLDTSPCAQTDRSVRNTRFIKERQRESVVFTPVAKPQCSRQLQKGDKVKFDFDGIIVELTCAIPLHQGKAGFTIFSFTSQSESTWNVPLNKIDLAERPVKVPEDVKPPWYGYAFNASYWLGKPRRDVTTRNVSINVESRPDERVWVSLVGKSETGGPEHIFLDLSHAEFGNGLRTRDFVPSLPATIGPPKPVNSVSDKWKEALAKKTGSPPVPNCRTATEAAIAESTTAQYRQILNSGKATWQVGDVITRSSTSTLVSGDSLSAAIDQLRPENLKPGEFVGLDLESMRSAAKTGSYRISYATADGKPTSHLPPKVDTPLVDDKEADRSVHAQLHDSLTFSGAPLSSIIHRPTVTDTAWKADHFPSCTSIRDQQQQSQFEKSMYSYMARTVPSFIIPTDTLPKEETPMTTNTTSVTVPTPFNQTVADVSEAVIHGASVSAAQEAYDALLEMLTLIGLPKHVITVLNGTIAGRVLIYVGVPTLLMFLCNVFPSSIPKAAQINKGCKLVIDGASRDFLRPLFATLRGPLSKLAEIGESLTPAAKAE